MQPRSVFISSTYLDLKEYRRTVWDALKKLKIDVRGMEDFGARTEKPSSTCLAEVEQSDIYVGIVAYRLGSIDEETNKPFTILEYEKAVDQNKQILIYLADDDAPAFPVALMDKDVVSRNRLVTFKERLRKHHTVDIFSSPQVLAEKLSRDIKKLIQSEEADNGDVKPDEDVFAVTSQRLKEFLLTPKRYNGVEVRLQVKFYGEVFPASRDLCEQFNLEYGDSIGCGFSIVRPPEFRTTSGLSEMFAGGTKIESFRRLVALKDAEVYAQLQFSKTDVKSTRAEFLGCTHYYEPDDAYIDPQTFFVPPEGKVILLFTKSA